MKLNEHMYVYVCVYACTQTAVQIHKTDLTTL